MAVLLPFFAVTFFSDNPPLMAWLSYLPFSLPTAMPVRLFHGDAATWEPFVALAILVAATVACVLLGARLYDGSLLRTRGRTPLRTAWRERTSAAS